MKVQYSVDYHTKDQHPGSVKKPPKPLTVVILTGGTALQVMENAANKHGSPYEFTAKYDGGSLHGFFICTINGIPSNTPSSDYYWEFLIQFPDGTVKPSSVGVSTYSFNADGYGMIMRFIKTTQ